MDLDEGGGRKRFPAEGTGWAQAGMSGTGLRTSLGVAEATPKFHTSLLST